MLPFETVKCSSCFLQPFEKHVGRTACNAITHKHAQALCVRGLAFIKPPLGLQARASDPAATAAAAHSARALPFSAWLEIKLCEQPIVSALNLRYLGLKF